MSALALNAVNVPDLPDSGDAALIERFIATRDQAAFAEMVRRHGSLVYGVCRRVLSDRHDVEDAFQATFLVLVQDAGQLRNRKSLASFLYGVAYRSSLRVIRQKQRRRETTLVSETQIDDDVLGKLAEKHAQQVLDAELNQLPERYRQVLVLRYLVGKSADDIAAELRTSVGSVEGLLKRGKSELRIRLEKRGVSMGVALIAIEAMRNTTLAGCPAALIESTIQAGLAWKIGATVPLSVILSERAVELAGKELIAMTSISKTAVAVGITIGGLAVGFGGFSVFGHHPQPSAHARRVAVPAGGRTEVKADVRQFAMNDDLNRVSGLEEIANGAQPIELFAVDNPDGSAVNIAAAPEAAASNGPAEQGSVIGGGGVESNLKALRDTRTSFQFVDATLAETLAEVEKRHNVKIRIRPDARTANLKVNADIQDLSLHTALQMILEPARLDFYVRDNEIVVTPLTRKVALLPSQVDSKIRTRNELRLERVLQEKTEVRFTDTTLTDALRYLEKLHNIEIQIDEAGLREAGVSTDQNVTLNTEGHSLKDTLNSLLERLGLDYALRNDVLIVTTSDNSRTQYLETRVYRIDSKLFKATPVALMKVIRQQTGREEDWSDSGNIFLLGVEPQLMQGIAPIGFGLIDAKDGLEARLFDLPPVGGPGLSEPVQQAIVVRQPVPNPPLPPGAQVGIAMPPATSATPNPQPPATPGARPVPATLTPHPVPIPPAATTKPPEKFSMVIRQTRRVHEEIVDLLNQLQEN